VREVRGRQVEYRYNQSNPAAAGLRDAVLRTFALSDRLAAALAGVDGVQLAFIFGSFARNEAESGSDLDVFVVGSLGLRDVAACVMPVMRDLGREPNVVVMTSAELRQRSDSGDHFVTTVLAEPKMWLVGDDAELKKVSG
jgi:predicted nucleotidyltransferase